MKKICLLICFSLMLHMLCACSGKTEELREPVNFYYCNIEIDYNTFNGVIHAETHEGAGFYGNLNAFLHAYLLGPDSDELYSLIPSEVYLVSCELDGDEVSIVLSKQFEKLSGVDLSIACSALLMTVHEYTGANTMIISAKDGKLDDKDQITISMDNIVLLDTSV